LTYEKEKKINTVMLVTGVVLAAAGFAAYFMVNSILGIVMMIAGVAVIVIASTISGAFYKIDYIENRKKNEK
jgi:lipopolysaccharide export LptBFGC system permease protein LptF